MERDAYKFLVQIWLYGCVTFTYLGICLIWVGVYLLGTQVILWSRSGQWVSLPLLYLFVDPWPLLEEKLSSVAVTAIHRVTHLSSDPFAPFSDPLFILRMGFHTYFSGVSAWLMDPHDWVGVQRIIRPILETIPLSLFLMGSGAAIWKTAVIDRALAQNALENLSNESA